MRLLTGFLILVWQLNKLWLLMEDRRHRRRLAAFWARHEQNILAIRAGMPQPYPDNSVDWTPPETRK